MSQGSISDWRSDPAPPNDFKDEFKKEDYRQHGNINSIVDGSAAGMTGQITLWSAKAVPTGWLECDGSTLEVENYPNLFDVLVPRFDVIEFDIASDAIFYTGIEYLVSVGDKVTFKTDGSFPTGIAADTVYFVKEFPTADYAILATDSDLINTADLSGTQSGVHEMYMCPWADTAFDTEFSWELFTIPDLIRSFPFSRDNNPSNPPESTLGYRQTDVNDHEHELDSDSSHAKLIITTLGNVLARMRGTVTTYTPTRRTNATQNATLTDQTDGVQLGGISGGVSGLDEAPTKMYPRYTVVLYIIKT